MDRWLALRRMLACHVIAVDGAFAVLVGVGTTAGAGNVVVRHGDTSVDLVGYGLILLAVAGLPLRRRAPLVAFCVSYGALLVYLVLRYPFGPIVQVVGVTIYSVAAWRDVRWSAAVCGVALAVYVPVEIWWSGATVSVAGAVVTLAWTVVPWLAGLGIRTYRAVRVRLVAAERQRVGYQERLDIAKDVHDAVGHGLTVISMHAGIALHVLHERPDQVESGLRAIRAASGQALAELRAALAVLPEGVRQVPGLDRVASLAKAVAGEHLSVDVVVAGTRGPVPQAVDATGYRIVQESLTNVLRHAAARRATVTVRYERSAIRLTITDDGRGSTRDPEGSDGQGLAGMRERAHALGGAVHAGPRAGGGFQVRAVLPW